MREVSRGRLAVKLAVWSLCWILLIPQLARADVIKFTRPAPAEQLFNNGLAALAKNDLAGAESAFMQSLKLQPKAASSMLGLAQVAVKRGDRKAAADYLQRAFTMAPDSAEVQQDWGRYKYSEGKYKEAEAAFRAAARIDPTGVRARVDLGDMYVMAFRKPGEAIPFYREAITLDPKHGGAHYGLGMALTMSGDEAGAISSLSQAAALSPDNPLPYYQLGRLHESKRRFDQAMEAFGRALKVAPAFAPALYERGNLLLEKKDDAGAIREFSAAAKADPRLVDPHVRLGMIYQQRKQWAEAEASYLAAIKLDARHAVAYNNLAWMAAERKVELNDGLTWARKAISIAPAVSQFQTTLGWVQRARGELDQAAQTLARAAALKPERADAFYYLAMAHVDRGKRAEAIASLKKALAIDPRFPNAVDAKQRLKALGQS